MFFRHHLQLIFPTVTVKHDMDPDILNQPMRCQLAGLPQTIVKNQINAANAE